MGKAQKKVAILGGGIAGMTAAHELIERGFEVEVFDQHAIPGGKARSYGANALRPPPWEAGRQVDAVKAGNWPLPAEHGFRFFPGFYRHTTHTMKRIPFAGPEGSGRSKVVHNLVRESQILFAEREKPPFSFQLDSPLRRVWQIFRWNKQNVPLKKELKIIQERMGISDEDARENLLPRLLQLFTTCPERNLAEYEQVPWAKFHLDERGDISEGYQKYIVNGVVRSLVAAKPDQASTFTDGKILVQMLFDTLDPRYDTGRILNGPTNEVWIDPWYSYLEKQGVVFHNRSRVVDLDCAGGTGKVRGASIQPLDEEGQPRGAVTPVEADYYILALPLEIVDQLLPRCAFDSDPTLGDIRILLHRRSPAHISDGSRTSAETPDDQAIEWMTGFQIYLKEDPGAFGPGHYLYADSPWALTSLSQRQFWAPEYSLENYGDGEVKGVISAIISDWNTKGLYDKRAKDCTLDEIFAEVWEEMKLAHNAEGEVLRDDMVHSWQLDQAIEFGDRDKDGRHVPMHNHEPLMVNLTNSWGFRPEAYTRFSNLFLAADYIRTYTDLATMEAANEAARRAVNGIICQNGSYRPWYLRWFLGGHAYCKIFDLRDPMLLWVFRTKDKRRFKRGIPWKWKLSGWDLLHPVYFIFFAANILWLLIMVIWALFQKNVTRRFGDWRRTVRRSSQQELYDKNRLKHHRPDQPPSYTPKEP